MRNNLQVICENINLSEAEAFFYEILHPYIFNLWRQWTLRKNLHETLLNSQRRAVVLDVGSGTGNMVNLLPSENVVVACDLSPEMLSRNLATYKIVCEATCLPLKQKCFDVIISYALFHHLPRTQNYLEQLNRVAKKTCILYFDGEHFGKFHRRFRRKVFLYANFLLWLTLKPKRWLKLLRYIFYGREKHRIFLRTIDFEVTDGNVVDTNKICHQLRRYHFNPVVMRYDRCCFCLTARRR